MITQDEPLEIEASIAIRLDSNGSVCSFVRDGPGGRRRDERRLSSEEPHDDPDIATPMVLCALGTCTALTLRLFARSAGLDLGTITVGVTGFDGGRCARISRSVTFQRRVIESDRVRLAAVCEKTPWTLLLKSRIPLLTQVF